MVLYQRECRYQLLGPRRANGNVRYNVRKYGVMFAKSLQCSFLKTMCEHYAYVRIGVSCYQFIVIFAYVIIFNFIILYLYLYLYL